MASPRLERAPEASVAPVPPLATARVPARVRVPEVVTGPPEKESPVVPPEASTLVTVPTVVETVPGCQRLLARFQTRA